MPRKPIQLPREDIERAVRETTSMAKAARHLGVTYTSFIRYAKKYDLYAPNNGEPGVKRKASSKKIPIEELLARKESLGTARLKQRLLEAGLLKEECSECGLGPVWNGKRLVLQLDHRDGDSTNNELSNLRILCPNCHTQTPTFCRGQGKTGKTLAA